MINDYEMMGRCDRARGVWLPHRCCVYSRMVYSCEDCSFGHLREDCQGNPAREKPNND